MSQDQAEEAARLIEDRFPGVEADASDPKAFLTLGFDRWSAETVREGLVRVVRAGGDVGVLLEMFEDFLAYGYPYDSDADRWPGVPGD